MNEWISIKDQLPAHGVAVLIAWSNSGGCAVSVRRGKHWRDPNIFDQDEEFVNPTHWMALPVPPKKEEKPK